MKTPLTYEQSEDMAGRIYRRIQKLYARIVKEETQALKVHTYEITDVLRLYAYPVAMLAATEVLGVTKATGSRAIGNNMFRAVVLLMEEMLAKEVYPLIKDENSDGNNGSG
jgi:hypothetical protein